MLDLRNLLADLRTDQKTRFVIFTGAGRAFSCGLDFSKEAMSERHARPELASVRLWQLFAQDIWNALENLEQITIAALNGATIGAGLALAMTCDFRIASESAIFGVPEANLGIFFTTGATPRLTVLIGPSKAKEMIMTCDSIDAHEALRIGLVNKVVPSEELTNCCRELVEKLASKGPLALRISKKIVNAASLSRMADLYPLEPEVVEMLSLSRDVKEGAQAFAEKRPPRFDV
jgi:enoyl-CoA hydratase/carnithine racemase